MSGSSHRDRFGAFSPFAVKGEFLNTAKRLGRKILASAFFADSHGNVFEDHKTPGMAEYFAGDDPFANRSFTPFTLMSKSVHLIL